MPLVAISGTLGSVLIVAFIVAIAVEETIRLRRTNQNPALSSVW